MQVCYPNLSEHRGSAEIAFGKASRQAGFTLIELVIAIAIVAVLLAVGVPSLRDMAVSQRVRGAANDLYSDLIFARAEAIKRNAQVSVVRETGGWLQGWRVQAGGSDVRMQARITEVSYSGAADASIVYNPDGRTTLAGTASFNFSSASGGAVSMRCVVITPSGRPALLADSNRNGDCQDG
jgi:type IV fimbrial biogenesis protein FimT